MDVQDLSGIVAVLLIKHDSVLESLKSVSMLTSPFIR